ncbi:MAG: hypothetical protein V4583_13385, partial [Pseudomonadota bacterium]
MPKRFEHARHAPAAHIETDKIRLAAEELFGTILALNESGVATLMVEQNALEALSVSARAYVLVQGRPERRNASLCWRTGL